MACDLQKIAEQCGAPAYVYDLDIVHARISRLNAGLDPAIALYYAAKANPNLEILKWMRDKVKGLDISSGGEFTQSVLAGYNPQQFSFAGPGKSERELTLAIVEGCGSINVESLDELTQIVAIAKAEQKQANILLRINPLHLINKFAIKMGGKSSAFGFDEEQLAQVVAFVKNNAEFLNWRGFHVYSGTQCLDAASLVEYYTTTLQLIENIAKPFAVSPTLINLGGGMGIDYFSGGALDEQTVLAGLNAAVKDYTARYPQTKFILELGRYIIGPAGYYLAPVVAVKESRGRAFAVLDGGMHHNLAAAGHLGQIIKKNYHVTNETNPHGAVRTYDIAGCLCTPLDTLATNAAVPEIRRGDILAFHMSGAYGYTSSPLFFLGHPTPLEIACERGVARVIREPRTLQDLN